MEILKAIGPYGIVMIVFMLSVGFALANAGISTDKTNRRNNGK